MLRRILAMLALLFATGVAHPAEAYPTTAFVGGLSDYLVDESGQLDIESILDARRGT